jgi:hypothetical protein
MVVNLFDDCHLVLFAVIQYQLADPGGRAV